MFLRALLNMKTLSPKFYPCRPWRSPRKRLSTIFSGTKRRQRFFIVPVTIVITSSLAFGQSKIPVYKAAPPKFAGTYDMATGKLSQSNTSGPRILYNNNTLTNYYSVPGADQEWIDEGQFCGQESVQINGFNFAYCSTEADATQNSGNITFTFYDDFTICAGPTHGGNFANGGFVCAYDIVGLPLGDPNGVIQCWIVTIDLSGGFECPNALATQSQLSADESNGKLFGWGFIPRQNNTGPWIATGGKGADNAFVWFDAFGIFQGCFWFGGTPFASFAIAFFAPPIGTFCYYPAGPEQEDDNVFFKIIGNADGELKTTYAGNAGKAYILASPRADNLVLGEGTMLVEPPVVAPTPLPYGGGVFNKMLPIGSRYYLQVVETENGLPPSFTNIPNAWSQGYCVIFR